MSIKKIVDQNFSNTKIIGANTARVIALRNSLLAARFDNKLARKKRGKALFIF